MTFSLSNYLAADSAAHALRRDVRDGLTQTPKTLPPKAMGANSRLDRPSLRFSMAHSL